MTPNLYEPPKSDISVAGKPGSSVKAVVFGALIEIVGTFLVGVSIGIVYVVVLSRQGATPEEMQSALANMDPATGLGMLASVLGSLVSVLAGYVCARVANTPSYKSAYVLAGISFALGVVSGYGVYTHLALILLGALSVACVLVRRLAAQPYPEYRLPGVIAAQGQISASRRSIMELAWPR